MAGEAVERLAILMGGANKNRLDLWTVGFGAALGLQSRARVASIAEVERRRVACGEGFHGCFLDEVARGEIAGRSAAGLRDAIGTHLLLDKLRHFFLLDACAEATVTLVLRVAGMGWFG